MSRSSVLVLRAPLTGRIVPLEEVPDPVFSSGIAGGGVAIAPASDTVLAPCDARVAHVHPAGHAVTLVTSDGVEVLIHVGLDTGQMHISGCVPHVAPGMDVRVGDALLELDLPHPDASQSDRLTTVLVGPPARISSVDCELGLVTAGLDVVLRVELRVEVAKEARGADLTATVADVASRELRVTDPSGLHARAAARVADAARQCGADVWVAHGDARTAATSLIGLLSLDVPAGELVRVEARGQHARGAVEAVAGALQSPTPGTETASAALSNAAVAVAGTAPSTSGARRQFAGTCASPGMVIGPAIHVRRQAPEQAGQDHPRARRERERLMRAIARARTALTYARDRAHEAAGRETADVIGVHEALLDDPALIGDASTNIARGLGAAQAWTAAVEAHAARLEGLRNPALASKADDLRDVGRRVLGQLGAGDHQATSVPDGAIAIATETDVSDILRLANAGIAGLVVIGTSAISHAAVVAQGFGLPMLASVDRRVLEIEDGTTVILDASAGWVEAAPTADAAQRAEARQREHTRARAAWLVDARAPAVTSDGRRVLVTGNIASVDDVTQLIGVGGEGVGLLRSEFLFLDRQSAPDEDEQAAIYGRMAAALGPTRHLVVRTFDAGGDKPLAFLPDAQGTTQPRRGLALTLATADVLRTQLRAVLRAAAEGNVRVLFPLVLSVEDWRSALAMLEEERRRLGIPPVPTGASIEVPTVVPLLDDLAQNAAFFAVGTNDLSSYTRNSRQEKDTAGVGSLDRAVLDVIAAAAATARKHGRAISVCGLAAADPAIVPLLVGLGIDELSVAVPAIPAVKAHVRTLDSVQCERMAKTARAIQRSNEARIPLDDTPSIFR